MDSKQNILGMQNVGPTLEHDEERDSRNLVLCLFIVCFCFLRWLKLECVDVYYRDDLIFSYYFSKSVIDIYLSLE